MSWPTTWRMIVPVAAVSLLLLTVGTSAGWYVHKLNHEISLRLAEHVAAVGAYHRLALQLRDVRLDLDFYADTSNSRYLDAATGSRREIERSLGEVEQGTAESDSLELREETCRAVRRFLDRLDDFAERPAEGESSRGTRQLITDLSRNVIAPAEKLLEVREETAARSSLRNEIMARRIGLGLLLLGLCGASAGLLAGYGIAGSLHRSIVQLRIPVRDMAGKLNEVVGPITVAADADLQELQAALQQLVEKTTEAVQHLQASQHQQIRSEQLSAVGQLAAGLAHELRNPLMSIKLLVQSAAERCADPSTSVDPALNPRDLQVLEDEIVRLEQMLQAFLDFARPPVPIRSSLDLRMVTEQVLRVVRPRASQQEVQIHCDFPDELPAVEADAAQLRQVLLNLLLNALDVLPDGGNVRLRAGLAHRTASGNWSEVVGPRQNGENDDSYVWITVADDGPGLPSEFADRVFDPFVSSKATGTGLGLSICRQILESHGGQILVQNASAGGAQFLIQLPLDGAALPAVPSTPVSGNLHLPNQG